MRGLWFDEAFNEDGTLRRPYASLWQCSGQDPLRPTVPVAEQLRDRPFGDDARVFPVPVVLDDAEYRSVIQAGVRQRALALQQFFDDMVLGDQQVLTAGTGLDRDLLDEILAAVGTSLPWLRNIWPGHGRDAIQFVYGPDLVRGPDGRWMVLEDNIGCVGGSADAFFVADRYRTASGMPSCPVCQPEPDLAVAIRRWIQRLRRPQSGVAAVLGCDTAICGQGSSWLDENARRRLILDQLAIPVIDRDLLKGQEAATPTTLVNFGVDESWAEVFSRPGIAMFNAPGTGVMGAKALLPYIDDIVRYYMRDEPILATPPTRLLADGVLPADSENWVVKTSAGCQGSEVFVLGWQSRDQLRVIQELVHNNWTGAAAVAQRYVEPSRLTPAGWNSWDGYRVEIRPVTYVLGWQAVYVSEHATGKVVSVYDPRRLNNISQGACYAPVLRQPCRGCSPAV